jgi:hypothetical protein
MKVTETAGVIENRSLAELRNNSLFPSHMAGESACPTLLHKHLRRLWGRRFRLPLIFLSPWRSRVRISASSHARQ